MSAAAVAVHLAQRVATLQMTHERARVQIAAALEVIATTDGWLTPAEELDIVRRLNATLALLNAECPS